MIGFHRHRLSRYSQSLYMNTTRLITALLLVLTLAACSKRTGKSGPSNKVRVGYIGLTCEAPIFVAVEKGFFKEEGLEVELVKCNWAAYKDALALGSFDITHHLTMLFLKPIEQGLDVRFLAGIHRGCLRVQAGVKTNIYKAFPNNACYSSHIYHLANPLLPPYIMFGLYPP